MAVFGATFVNATLTVAKYAATRIHPIVDGVLAASNIYIAPGTTNFALVTGLDPSVTHHIQLYNSEEPAKSDSWAGPLQFNGFTTDGTAVPLAQRPLRLAWLGDSITSGSGSVGVAPCKESINTTDHAISYGARVCRGLGANCSFVSWSGKGMYENCCDPPGNPSPRMPEYYTQVLGGQTGTPNAVPWDPTSYPWDALLINLGTNDFGGGKDNGTAWEAAFRATYLQFVTNNTGFASKPGAPVFALVGAITDDYLPAVQELVAEGRAQGVNMFAVAMINGTNGTRIPCTGCNGHPGYGGHQMMAAVLGEAVSNATGWAWNATAAGV